MPVKQTVDFMGKAAVTRREGILALRDSMQIAESAVNARYRGGTGAATLARRTGLLAGSVRRSFEDTGTTISAKVYIPVQGGRSIPRYALAHETGMTILPKKGRYLAIPLPSLRGSTAAGGISRGPRDFPGGFFFRSRAGNLLFAIRQGRGGRLVPLFVLKQSVRIPRRPVWAAARAETRPRILERFAEARRRIAQSKVA